METEEGMGGSGHKVGQAWISQCLEEAVSILSCSLWRQQYTVIRHESVHVLTPSALENIKMEPHLEAGFIWV